MDSGAWWAGVHWITKSQTRPANCLHLHFPSHLPGGRTCWALLKETLTFPLFPGATLKKLGDVQVTLGGTQ